MLKSLFVGGAEGKDVVARRGVVEVLDAVVLRRVGYCEGEAADDAYGWWERKRESGRDWTGLLVSGREGCLSVSTREDETAYNVTGKLARDGVVERQDIVSYYDWSVMPFELGRGKCYIRRGMISCGAARYPWMTRARSSRSTSRRLQYGGAGVL